ncbi:outer membrane protein assembly factor BamB family protein [Halorussus halobius]|uniref:outer membrane protein assembly factor BamB family protein n=1 Tax=Halorussus halobius TaxID=1710537 RepID=UPI00143D89C1|nr:PQQ-binding-like beta-propeller repeat protein [Halorussus halobius]
MTAVDVAGGIRWTYRHSHERGPQAWARDGRVAITSSTTDANPEQPGSQNRFETVVLDAESGETLWDVPTDPIQDGKDNHVSGIAFDGRRLAIFAPVNCHVFDVEEQTHVGTIPIDASWASPKLVEGMLYGGGYTLECYDWQNQTLKWETSDVGPADTPPTVTEQAVLVATRDGVGAYDRADGEERWFVPTKHRLNTSPVVQGEIVWVGDDNGVLHGINYEQGEEVIAHSVEKWDSNSIEALCAYKSSLYVGCSDVFKKYVVE